VILSLKELLNNDDLKAFQSVIQILATNKCQIYQNLMTGAQNSENSAEKAVK